MTIGARVRSEEISRIYDIMMDYLNYAEDAYEKNEEQKEINRLATNAKIMKSLFDERFNNWIAILEDDETLK